MAFPFGHEWPYAAKHRDVLERALRLPKSDRLLEKYFMTSPDRPLAFCKQFSKGSAGVDRVK